MRSSAWLAASGAEEGSVGKPGPASGAVSLITRRNPVSAGRSAPTASPSPRVDAAQQNDNRSFPIGPSFPMTWYRIELKSMANQVVAKLIGDQLLQPFDLFVAKFDHPTGLQVN